MCIGNFTESGHGGRFKPCKEYDELKHKYALLQEKVERLKWRLLDKAIDIFEKGPAKSYEIFVDGVELDENFQFHGWYRQDLEKPNWHYYEGMDGTILHFRKDRMICVVEKEIKDDSDE